jgi:hypothetical protein
MSQVTELSSGHLNGAAAIVIELIEADETPAVVILSYAGTAEYQFCSI